LKLHHAYLLGIRSALAPGLFLFLHIGIDLRPLLQVALPLHIETDTILALGTHFADERALLVETAAVRKTVLVREAVLWFEAFLELEFGPELEFVVVLETAPLLETVRVLETAAMSKLSPVLGVCAKQAVAECYGGDSVAGNSGGGVILSPDSDE
jgi:hypothetical protein